jgi:molybdopterin-guanine dinucleotide biosynthesis protein A/molybdopterin-guanine dinucleotide biosynthesis protein
MTVLGAILAGGRSTRMGSDKAGVVVGDRTMLDRVAGAVSAVADEVVLLGESRPGYECWPDEPHSSGPLAGIVTALERSSHPRVLVVAVDNALVRSETLTGLVGLESNISVVPVDASGVRQVTCAIYPRGIAGQAREEAGSGGSVQSLLDRVSFEPVTPDVWEAWGEDGRSWLSLDSPERVAEAVARYGV